MAASVARPTLARQTITGSGAAERVAARSALKLRSRSAIYARSSTADIDASARVCRPTRSTARLQI